MKQLSKLKIAIFAAAIGCSYTYMTPQVQGDNTDPALAPIFKALYDATANTRVGHETELAKQADEDMLSKKYTEACANYLAAATDPLLRGGFEKARPFLDKMFIAASKMPVAEQRQMLLAFNEIQWSPLFDRNNYKYWQYEGEQRLKLLQMQPGATAADRLEPLQVLELSYTIQGKYREAESLLLENRKQLKEMNPPPPELGWCEDDLANLYNSRGDMASALRCYSEASNFGRQHNYQDVHIRALEDEIQLLLRHNMSKEIVPVAEEYFTVARSPQQVQWRDRVAWNRIASELANVAPDLANKYYAAGFEQTKKNSRNLNSDFGTKIAEWAAMLHRSGKDTEALKVLEDAMNVCKTTEFYRAKEQFMPALTQPYEEYLRAANRFKEAADFQASLEHEEEAKRLNEQKEQEAKISDPNAAPDEKIQALVEKADEAFSNSDCDKGCSYIQEAIAVYEKNANREDTASIYQLFTNVGKHLAECKRSTAVEPSLLRIVRARMVYGFGEYDYFRGPEMNAEALGELFPDVPAAGADRLPLLNQLIAEAKASGKPVNVVLLLSRLARYQKSSAEKAAVHEQMETWTAKQNKPESLFKIMVETANLYIAANELDQAAVKWKEAVESLSNVKPNEFTYSVSETLCSVAATFEIRNELSRAGECYLAALKLALNEPDKTRSQSCIKRIDLIANKMREADAQEPGALLLKQALSIAKTKEATNSTLPRTMFLKLAIYYAKCGEKGKVSSTCNELLDSIKQRGAPLSAVTCKEMDEAAQILKDHDFDSEAARLRDQIKLAESQHSKDLPTRNQ